MRVKCYHPYTWKCLHLSLLLNCRHHRHHQYRRDHLRQTSGGLSGREWRKEWAVMWNMCERWINLKQLKSISFPVSNIFFPLRSPNQSTIHRLRTSPLASTYAMNYYHVCVWLIWWQSNNNNNNSKRIFFLLSTFIESLIELIGVVSTYSCMCVCVSPESACISKVKSRYTIYYTLTDWCETDYNQ